MRNFIKIFTALSLMVLVFACSSNSKDDLKYGAQEEIGWIQFPESNPDVITGGLDAPEVIQIGVNIQVPVTTQDLVITYDLVPVSGGDPNNFFSNNGQIVSPAGETSYSGPDNRTGFEYGFLPTIDIDISEITTTLNEPLVFDVVLTSTNIAGVTVGLPGETFPTVQRVQICPSVSLAGDVFLGAYILTVPSGPSLFATPIFTDGITVTLVASGVDGTSRSFMAPYLPAFSASPETLTFSFVNGKIIIQDTITTTGCGAAITIGANTDAILSTPCDDSSIRLNYFDFLNGTGDCGVSDEPIQLLLTKV